MGYRPRSRDDRQAHALDLLTTPYVFDPGRGRAMSGGRRRHHRGPHGPHHRRRDRRHAAKTLDDASARSTPSPRRRWPCATTSSCCATAARSPMPDDAAYILGQCKHCHGFYGASSMERLPVETAITEQTRRFKEISF